MLFLASVRILFAGLIFLVLLRGGYADREEQKLQFVVPRALNSRHGEFAFDPPEQPQEAAKFY